MGDLFSYNCAVNHAIWIPKMLIFSSSSWLPTGTGFPIYVAFNQCLKGYLKTGCIFKFPWRGDFRYGISWGPYRRAGESTAGPRRWLWSHHDLLLNMTTFQRPMWWKRDHRKHSKNLCILIHICQTMYPVGHIPSPEFVIWSFFF